MVEDIKGLISQMTLEEKVSFLSGADVWNTKAIERLGIPSIMVTDGPHGLRKQIDAGDHLGINNSVPSTCFPTACTTACSFDRDLLHEIGEALGDECLEENVSILLGPGINIKRSPLCGRNFEYFSEDPLLSGELAASYINGVQKKGIGTSLKHYAVNNQEKRRMTVDAVVDERALHEIYLKGFEIAVKKSKPWTVMCSYNKINGYYGSENSYLLTKVLRSKWEFEGATVTDWGAANNRVEGIKAGLDLEMPGSSGSLDVEIIEGVKTHNIKESHIDKAVENLLTVVFKNCKNGDNVYKYDREIHHNIARKAAQESSVLLKNKDSILPLNNEQSIAVIGAFAKKPRYQGAGSSKVNPTKLSNAYDEFVKSGLNFEYAKGYDLSGRCVEDNLIEEAKKVAKEKDIVVIFAGLPDEYESEGFDRNTLEMPRAHTELIKEVSKVNPNVVVFLYCGAPVEMPWIHDVKAVLLCYLGGQAVGEASVDLLLGKANPCGKLAETFPLKLSDNPSYNYFPGTDNIVEYRESIYVGYRYYDKVKKDVLFPFGYGLSYTSFEYSDLRLDKKEMDIEDRLKIRLNVKNTGKLAGKEIVQLYIRHKHPSIFKADKELKEFLKIHLEAGEQVQVEFTLDKSAFEFYNININNWDIESGEYEILIGSSSQNIHLMDVVKVTNMDGNPIPDYSSTDYYNLPKDELKISKESFEKIYGRAIPMPSQKEEYNLNSTLNDVKNSFIGKLIIKFVQKESKRLLGDDPGEDMLKMVNESIWDMPIRALVMFSNGMFSKTKAEGVIDMLNKRYISGIKKALK